MNMGWWLIGGGREQEVAANRELRLTDVAVNKWLRSSCGGGPNFFL